ncbi:nif-specific transcriptional activator NifA [Rhodospira trueperi]|uniref:Nif-specific regulatory protein n=1 Tax=Rhodospira trueperi TaxID=69960 RepID=A0A1G7E0T2_9PROT|nr:nif-specific transcriptional activator NifA [Rhodospira trueperi]SDE57328.1 Nif-specific regulatory protein [Rhodospira trueperi]
MDAKAPPFTSPAPSAPTETTVVSGSLPLLTLYEISKILSATLQLDQTLRDVLNVLSSYLDMRRGTIALATEPATESPGEDAPLGLVAIVGQSLETARKGRGAYPLEAADQVYRSNLPLLVGRLSDDDRFSSYADHSGSLETDRVSFLCVPIRAGDSALGTLSVEREWDGPPPRSFDEDLRFLSMVGNLIGQTVQLHRLVAADRRTLMADAARLEKLARHEARSGGGTATGSSNGRTPRFKEIVGRGPAMRAVLDQVRHVARTRASVMVRGESGTGKEMVARAIHQVSPRSDKPFVCVNCAALPDTLLESELFGHDKGAFTGANSERKGRFEMADGGTLFLDEIGEISAAFQAKLLRVLQEGQFERLGSSKTRKVDVRLIAATNRHLEEAVARGEFRADLYYRINVVTLVLPPLRDRPEDVEPLARHFLDRFNQENGDNLGLAPEALDLLRGCAFPGNVRELENCITRVATMVRGDVIGAQDFACREAGCLSSALWREVQGPTQAVGGLASPTPGAPCPSGTSGGTGPGCASCTTGTTAVQGPASPGPASQGPARPAPPIPTPAERPRDMAPHDTAPNADDGGGSSGRLPDRERLVAAMEKTGWVQAKAARLLGLTPRQVGYALRRHGIAIKRL